MIKFAEIDWADSSIKSILLEYDKATLKIWNDALQKYLRVECSGLAGITNLCIWDDTIIFDSEIYPVDHVNSDFLKNLFVAYDKDFDYGGRSLSDGLIEWRVELVNNISFSLYCLRIAVFEDENE